jgi:hypothetical protein
VIVRVSSLIFGTLTLAAAAPAHPGGFRFVDRAAEAGLTAPTWCGGREKPHILESGGTGLALFDYDLDGDLDLYLVNGWRLDGPTVVERGRNHLYRNRGDGTFDDVTEVSGTGDDGWGTGVAVGDPDGDGDPDLFVSNFGPDVLYLNRGDGTYAAAPDPPSIDGWSTGAVFFDADCDGDEDLFVGAYIDCALDEVLHAEPRLDWQGMKVMLGPFGLEGKANRYFVNEGGAHFREATEEAGLVDVGLFYSFGVVAVDLDGDLDPDLYVANDSNPNYLYRNDGHGRFEEVGLWSGAALDQGGMAQAGMGVTAGELDGGGGPDLLVTNFSQDTSTLYLDLGDLVFEDATRKWGLYEPTYHPLSWGPILADFDQDGHLDLFVANGHIYPQADRVPGGGWSFGQRNLLLDGSSGSFVDVTAEAGPGLEVEASSRGVAAGDIDGDGDLDLAVANVDVPPTLLRNDSKTGSWLLVDASQAAVVSVRGNGPAQLRYWSRGGSYVSVSDLRHHFGLAGASEVAELRVQRFDGSRRVYRDLPADRVLCFPR